MQQKEAMWEVWEVERKTRDLKKVEVFLHYRNRTRLSAHRYSGFGALT